MKRLKKKTWKLKSSSVFVPPRHIASIEFVFVQKKYTIMRSKRTLMEGFTIVLFWFSLFTIFIISSAIDSITATQSIRDGETIVSAAGSFELGFFSPGNSKNRYVGIWYKISTTTVVWVANRESPLLDSSGVLKVTNQGILTILNGNGSIIWSSNSTRAAQNPVAVLLNSGNLVVRDGNDNNRENFLWQSFDYPCDTLLPGMKLGRDLETGIDRYISSWKSNNDPSRGDFTFRLDPRGFPQLVLMKESVEQFRSGPWNGLRFSGTPNLKPNQFYKFNFIFSDHEIYYIYEPLTSTVVTRMVLNQIGQVQRFIWIDQTHSWSLYLAVATDNCDDYAFCGAHGSCNIGNSPECGCLKGFEPKFQKQWDAAYWSNGCVRRTSLDCQKGDGFLKYSGMKLPDVRNSSFDRSMNLEECRMVCLKNCSCMAYSNLDISEGGRGCLLWFGDLIDIREFNQNGQDIYIRMASSEIGKVGSDRKKQKRYIAASVILTVMLLLGLGLTMYLLKKNKLKRQAKLEHGPERSDSTECKKEDLELPLFDYDTIADATDNFSVSNKLGEGGFGPVYKGMLNDGQEIAVKRLSKNSTQGIDEFKNEVLCIAKLQHRNLVKLLGCCIDVEKILIYEYMPNKSLDYFIFDQTRSKLIDWPKRFQIINGISRGLLYLHQDSRLRIIHRDLKTSNILLDHELNPKISDFGVARSFGGNETEANTTRIVGTYGYMSPEYAIDGLFSVKSDVFNFGVLVLEIVSGKKNRGFHHQIHGLNLLGHAWTLYNEGRCYELIDAAIRNSYNQLEVLRSIHVGLLCVQQRPEDRPNMSIVVLMLGSEIALPQPKQPGFFSERNLLETESSLSKHDSCTTNKITVTLLDAR